MSKWSGADERDAMRAAIVGRYTAVSALDYLREHSQADPEGADA